MTELLKRIALALYQILFDAHPLDQARWQATAKYYSMNVARV